MATRAPPDARNGAVHPAGPSSPRIPTTKLPLIDVPHAGTGPPVPPPPAELAGSPLLSAVPAHEPSPRVRSFRTGIAHRKNSDGQREWSSPAGGFDLADLAETHASARSSRTLSSGSAGLPNAPTSPSSVGSSPHFSGITGSGSMEAARLRRKLTKLRAEMSEVVSRNAVLEHENVTMRMQLQDALRLASGRVASGAAGFEEDEDVRTRKGSFLLSRQRAHSSVDEHQARPPSTAHFYSPSLHPDVSVAAAALLARPSIPLDADADSTALLQQQMQNMASPSQGTRAVLNRAHSHGYTQSHSSASSHATSASLGSPLRRSMPSPANGAPPLSSAGGSQQPSSSSSSSSSQQSSARASFNPYLITPFTTHAPTLLGLTAHSHSASVSSSAASSVGSLPYGGILSPLLGLQSAGAAPSVPGSIGSSAVTSPTASPNGAVGTLHASYSSHPTLAGAPASMHAQYPSSAQPGSPTLQGIPTLARPASLRSPNASTQSPRFQPQAPPTQQQQTGPATLRHQLSIDTDASAVRRLAAAGTPAASTASSHRRLESDVASTPLTPLTLSPGGGVVHASSRVPVVQQQHGIVAASSSTSANIAPTGSPVSPSSPVVNSSHQPSAIVAAAQALASIPCLVHSFPYPGLEAEQRSHLSAMASMDSARAAMNAMNAAGVGGSGQLSPIATGRSFGVGTPLVHPSPPPFSMEQFVQSQSEAGALQGAEGETAVAALQSAATAAQMGSYHQHSVTSPSLRGRTSTDYYTVPHLPSSPASFALHSAVTDGNPMRSPRSRAAGMANRTEAPSPYEHSVSIARRLSVTADSPALGSMPPLLLSLTNSNKGTPLHRPVSNATPSPVALGTHSPRHASIPDSPLLPSNAYYSAVLSQTLVDSSVAGMSPVVSVQRNEPPAQFWQPQPPITGGGRSGLRFGQAEVFSFDAPAVAVGATSPMLQLLNEPAAHTSPGFIPRPRANRASQPESMQASVLAAETASGKHSKRAASEGAVVADTALTVITPSISPSPPISSRKMSSAISASPSPSASTPTAEGSPVGGDDVGLITAIPSPPPASSADPSPSSANTAAAIALAATTLNPSPPRSRKDSLITHGGRTVSKRVTAGSDALTTAYLAVAAATQARQNADVDRVHLEIDAADEPSHNKDGAT